MTVGAGQDLRPAGNSLHNMQSTRDADVRSRGTSAKA
eukprot:CAMPEP_0203961664 /NCGR_PEP_ID=MMETSP0359-20131031/92049_1 /ASSEMBLY_ACC=CAM_ASM_000338 /TAXON_ID=268821 /ORGANISM="Scrippsiella Hangoei, Strain SHTV-5" /LENGTH=36 /DNA_ID= /DNA_START= /DNA_END= /DNA_ORIENTATION=